MKQNYFEEIEHLIRRNEINKKARVLEDNSDTLKTNCLIGKLLVEAQGGETRAKYGNELIKEWSKEYTEKYGKNYSERNLRYMRQFYNMYPIWQSVIAKLTWTHFLKLLPLKEENKRNYYINLCIEKNLSVRGLIQEIKNNSYDRLINKPEKIEIINNNKLSILDNIMNPIIIKLGKNDIINNEHDLQMKIISELQVFFNQLGNGFCLVGSEYKINYNNKNYFVDLLLFNYLYNKFVVVELKIRELKREDKAQVRFYMELVDKCIKKYFHNNTIGIIITKEQDKYIATFVSEEDIIPITYMLTE